MGKPTKEEMLEFYDNPPGWTTITSEDYMRLHNAIRALIERGGERPRVTMAWIGEHFGDHIDPKFVAQKFRSIGVEVEGDTNEH